MNYFHYTILLKTKKANTNDEKLIDTWCQNKQEVIYYTKRIGEFDYEINFTITNITELNDTITNFRNEFGEIINSYELVLNKAILKLNYVPF